MTKALRDREYPFPAASIITPYFNTGVVFLETVRSVQSQTLQNWEWLIVDDGSTDRDSISALERLAASDQRVRVISQHNAGPAAARNLGARNARASYLCLIDSDDLIEPTYLEKCVWFLESQPEFSFANTYSVLFGTENRLHPAGFEAGAAHIQANVGPPIAVVRRSAYAACGGFDESIRLGHEDWDFWLAMAKSGHWGHTIPEFLQWYRKRSDGRFEEILRSGDLHVRFEELMRSKYAGLAERFPRPRLRQALAYENVPVDFSIENPRDFANSRRKVLFIIPWMVTGGADRVNLDLIEGLVSKGLGVVVCATLAAEHTWEHHFCELTPDVFVLPNFLHASDYPRFLVYLIRSRQIDSVVISGSTIGYQLLAYLRAHCPATAFLDMSHVEESWWNGGHPRFGVGYQDLLDANIVTTQHLADWMVQRGADRSRIEVMYSGVRSAPGRVKGNTERSIIRADLGIAESGVVIVFAGRICQQKRPEVLAAILHELHRRQLDFDAIVIGDGDLAMDLERRLSPVSPRIRMLGVIEHSEWLKLLCACDIFLMPSEYEGISMALLEAIAGGVVPVVSRVGGQDEIVPPDAGVLIPLQPDEHEAMVYADALQALILDRPRLLAMSVACTQLATARLSWSAMIDRFQAVLDRAQDLRMYEPRTRPSFGLAQELTTQAFELNRLTHALNWSSDIMRQIKDDQSLLTSPGETEAIAKMAARISRSKLFIRLVRIPVLRRIGRRLYNLLSQR